MDDELDDLEWNDDATALSVGVRIVSKERATAQPQMRKCVLP